MKGGLRQSVLWTLTCAASFYCADYAIFQTGIYPAWVRPRSLAGEVETRLYWLRHEPAIPETVVVGDSRVREGFSARVAAAATGSTMRFRNLGASGATPRVWYYMLRDADPNRNRFTRIVLAMDRYTDADWPRGGDQRGDATRLAGRLKLTDCPEYVMSFRSAGSKMMAAIPCLFRGYALRNDVQDFLRVPAERAAAVRRSRQQGHELENAYEGLRSELTGLKVDRASGTITPPGSIPSEIREKLSWLLEKKDPQTGNLRRHRTFWLNKILDLYKGTPTQFIFVQMPRGPVAPPEWGVPAYTIDRIGRLPQVTVIPADTFTDLERPEYFADPDHLNFRGRPIFSERLGRILQQGAKP